MRRSKTLIEEHFAQRLLPGEDGDVDGVLSDLAEALPPAEGHICEIVARAVTDRWGSAHTSSRYYRCVAWGRFSVAV